MTEGAKTESVDDLHRRLQREKRTYAPSEMWGRAQKLERKLTEALKVAGDLAGFTKHSALCNGALNGRCTCGRNDAIAALERIRNNKH